MSSVGILSNGAGRRESKVTAFITPLGLYKWKRLPMGIASAPGAFQNQMELIFAGLSYKVALVYVDGVIVFGRIFEEHFKRLKLVFQRLSENGLKIKGSKCNFFQRRVSYLGHIISESGVEVDLEKVRAVGKKKKIYLEVKTNKNKGKVLRSRMKILRNFRSKNGFY